MSGECYYNHPELFKMDDEGYPIVLVDDIQDDAMKKHAREAVEVCPAVAISVES
ncbi:MAG: ferredoxin [Pseudomonadales bacterium]|nr:ferredoxin [Pseudomonadales bacterium]MBO6566637.1 ferredoxin [Pseudomonadales bacterium]MBO6595726.1 ferredoxin [Pseudomonadales bacterium]MBO6658780.1 ferredoxin [Pseudomonadales bacterium]MBO6702226.1 ferredoxin [Pseudomonadales bacterium]